MLIDTLLNDYNTYSLKLDNLGLESDESKVYRRLVKFILEGSYTRKANKDYLLSNWLSMSGADLANSLNVSPAAIHYAKAGICKDLVKELGESLDQVLANRNFRELEFRLNRAEKRQKMPKNLFFKELGTHLKERLANEVDDSDLVREKELLQELEKPMDFNNPLFMALETLKKFYLPIAFDEVDQEDALALNVLVDVLNGKKGSVIIRNNLQSFLED